MALIFYIIHNIITYKYISCFAWEPIKRVECSFIENPQKNYDLGWVRFLKTLTIEDELVLVLLY